MLSFDVKKLVFKFDGKEYSIDYPTIKKVNKFRKELDKQDSDQVDSTINFLCELGAERDIIESLRVGQLNQLVEELTSELSSSKKN